MQKDYFDSGKRFCVQQYYRWLFKISSIRQKGSWINKWAKQKKHLYFWSDRRCSINNRKSSKKDKGSPSSSNFKQRKRKKSCSESIFRFKRIRWWWCSKMQIMYERKKWIQMWCFTKACSMLYLWKNDGWQIGQKSSPILRSLYSILLQYLLSSMW